MNILLLADLHLTANPRDAYRWRLFSWLMTTVPKHSIKNIIILGDLTESKNYHGAHLVNRIVDELCKLHDETGVVFLIVPGNHDSIDPECPYFRFLGKFNFINYIPTPFLAPLAGRKVLFLPHTKTPEAWPTDLLYEAEVIFMHQTVSGAKSETGISLEGMAATALAGAKRAKIWSGDVHVPQKIGAVEYVGAPYPVRFGDAFKPRAVLLTDSLKKATDLETPHFARRTVALLPGRIQQLADEGLKKGDQVKVRIQMTRSQYVDWEKEKRSVIETCTKLGVELCGLEVVKVDEAVKAPKRGSAAPAALSPVQVLSAWAEKQKLDKGLIEAGQKILLSIAG